MKFLEEHPLPKSRNKSIADSELRAANAILSNYSREPLPIRNYQGIKTSEYGFSYAIFCKVITHIHETGVIFWSGYGSQSPTTKSTIQYVGNQFQPWQMIYTPPHTIEANIKRKNDARKERVTVKLNTKAKITHDKNIRKIWDYLKKQDIQHNVTKEMFEIVCEYNKFIGDKDKSPVFPDKTKICPVAVYNDRSISIGGRFYRAFWIGEGKDLRRLITINGEATADIDGKSMHVQLLYMKAKLPLPEGELYIYPKSDPRRKIAKKLMLYMMNTRKNWQGDSGRMAVIKTYLKHNVFTEDLMPVILELEAKHEGIKQYLYQSNWGELQGTEAGIILGIMLKAMKEDIVCLPVHDGLICQRKHRDRVLEIFGEVGIVAEENTEHLEQLNLEKMRVVYDLKKSVKMTVGKTRY
ncbi:MAG: hypothetical protein PF440_06760 [Thiomicrorhabdus sp.]|nr:hypothetical protein [Thiomicrorhabdus sp.]